MAARLSSTADDDAADDISPPRVWSDEDADDADATVMMQSLHVVTTATVETGAVATGGRGGFLGNDNRRQNQSPSPRVLRELPKPYSHATCEKLCKERHFDFKQALKMRARFALYRSKMSAGGLLGTPQKAPDADRRLLPPAIQCQPVRNVIPCR